jgi:hypothetical protein
VAIPLGVWIVVAGALMRGDSRSAGRRSECVQDQRAPVVFDMPRERDRPKMLGPFVLSVSFLPRMVVHQ